MLNIFTLANGRLFQEEIESLEELSKFQPIWVDLEAPTPEEKRFKAAVADGSWNVQKQGGLNAFLNQMNDKDRASLANDKIRLANEGARLALSQKEFAFNTGGIMPTGGGKSLCYQLPALIMDGVAIIVSPLIALMKNQVDLIRGYSEEDNIAHFLNSSLNKGQIKIVKDDLSAGKTKLLYVAPETLTKQENLDFFKGIKISFVAVDEAHCISQWGYDFRPPYLQIAEVRERLKHVPIIALTATAFAMLLEIVIYLTHRPVVEHWVIHRAFGWQRYESLTRACDSPIDTDDDVVHNKVSRDVG
jgi:hypothetical protein